MKNITNFIETNPFISNCGTEFTDVKVYDMLSSLIASGYPMRKQNFGIRELTKQDITRSIKLACVASGSGHDSFLKGITVNLDIKAHQVFWLQFERYHYQDTISSQSTMHKITTFNNDELKLLCSPKVLPSVRTELIGLINKYNKLTETKEKEQLMNIIMDNIPQGIQLTRRVTLNYLQLKTIVEQRKYDKPYSWKVFIEWVKTLPMADKLIFNEQ